MNISIYDSALIAAVSALATKATNTSDSWIYIASAAHGIAAEVERQYPAQASLRETSGALADQDGYNLNSENANALLRFLGRDNVSAARVESQSQFTKTTVENTCVFYGGGKLTVKLEFNNERHGG